MIRVHKLFEDHLCKVQLERRQKIIEEESSHNSLQVIKGSMVTMKLNYLHLLDHDHLLNLTKIYLDALRGKEKEVGKLSHELLVTMDSLKSTQMALQEYEVQIDAIFLELILAQSSSSTEIA